MKYQQNIKAMRKNNTIISDLRTFFSKNDCSRAIDRIIRVMEHINIRPSEIGASKKPNCKFTSLQVLYLLILFAFFTVRNVYSYDKSSLSRLFDCHKDMFYRFMNDGNVTWRRLLYGISLRLLRKITAGGDGTGSKKPVCLIVDDTDAPKTGKTAEMLGKVFSHVQHRCILGYKCLTLLWSDGKSQLMLDFSLHGEKGKNPDKVQGLTRKEREARFSESHDGQAVAERVAEYTQDKISRAIDMVRHAISKGIRFDYLLCDNWFTCASLVRFIASRHIKCHLMGMIKMGNSKYLTQYGELNATQLVSKLKRNGLCKRCRTLKCSYCQADVTFAGRTVRLFFCKRGRGGRWNGMLTTDTSLTFLKAYRIYAMRWATEVAYRDCKTRLNLGRCQSVHFSAQIASFSLTMMQYDILCTVKRFEAYETLGGLFSQVVDDTLELSVTDKIWDLILELILELAELISADACELLSAVVNQNPRLMKLYQMNLSNTA